MQGPAFFSFSSEVWGRRDEGGRGFVMYIHAAFFHIHVVIVIGRARDRWTGAGGGSTASADNIRGGSVDNIHGDFFKVDVDSMSARACWRVGGSSAFTIAPAHGSCAKVFNARGCSAGATDIYISAPKIIKITIILKNNYL